MEGGPVITTDVQVEFLRMIVRLDPCETARSSFG